MYQQTASNNEKVRQRCMRKKSTECGKLHATLRPLHKMHAADAVWQAVCPTKAYAHADYLSSYALYFLIDLYFTLHNATLYAAGSLFTK